MSFDRVFSGDVFRLILSAIAGYWLLGGLLSFYAALMVGGGVLLLAAGAGAWARENGGLWKEMTRLQQVTWAAIAAAAFGVVDVLYWNFIVEGALGITIIHWFSFLGAIIGFVFFSYRIRYQEQQIGKQAKQIQLQAKQIRQQARKEIDDRFHSAVELLGNSEMSARTGAIYSLYHLAFDYEKYRRGVAQILCSHIRSKTQETQYQKEHKLRPSNEIQTAINLLFRYEGEIEGLYKDSKISAMLSIADLSRAYLVGADFSGGYLAGANLSFAYLVSGNLEDAHLVGADFVAATCRDADFREAQCQEARFGNANCQYINFSDANCQGASFYGAKCHIAIFEGANCIGVNFGDAECQGVSFEGARCVGANFSDANCQGAYFEETCLQGANFLDANCKGAYAKEISLNYASSALDMVQALENRIGKSTEFKTAAFAGGLDSDYADEIEEAREYLPDHKWNEMQEIIEANKGEISYDVPQDSGMIRGKLEKAEIQQVIDDAKKFRDAEQQE